MGTQKLQVTVETLDIELEGDKRQYLPCVLKWTCPCGENCEMSLCDQYLSYPVFGKEYECYLCCPKCEHEDSLKVIPRLTLEVVGLT